MEIYTNYEKSLMEVYGCVIHKIMTVEDQTGETGKIFEGFGEIVAREGEVYIEKVFHTGSSWRKEVVTFKSREGMDRWMKRFPGDQRFIGRDM